MTDELTRPERFAEIAQARRLRAKVYANPCAFCTQRVSGWGLAGCRHGLTFPMCTKGRNPRFELDVSAMEERGD